MDASTLHPECTLGRQTPVCRQLGHEAAFRADQGLRTRHGHRRLGNVVLSASLSGGRQWPTTVCCGHLSQMDTPLQFFSEMGRWSARGGPREVRGSAASRLGQDSGLKKGPRTVAHRVRALFQCIGSDEEESSRGHNAESDHPVVSEPIPGGFHVRTLLHRTRCP